MLMEIEDDDSQKAMSVRELFTTEDAHVRKTRKSMPLIAVVGKVCRGLSLTGSIGSSSCTSVAADLRYLSGCVTIPMTSLSTQGIHR